MALTALNQAFHLPRIAFVRIVCLLALAAMLPGCHAARRVLLPSGIPSSAEKCTLVAGEFELFFLRAGDPDGQRVLFLHGAQGNATDWNDYLKDADPVMDWVAVDRPGYAQTRPRGATSLEDNARAVAPLLVRRKGRGTIIVGHSYGVPVAVRTALANPDVVEGLVLVAGPLYPGIKTSNWWRPVFTVAPLKWLVPRQLETANREVLHLREELQNLEPELRKLTVPVVLIYGKKDSVVPFSHLAFATSHLPMVKDTIVIEDGRHLLLWTHEAKVRQGIEKLR